MRSIGGFNSEAVQGSFASGQPIQASALNKLATAADAARTMMSNDVTFFANTDGVSYGLPQQIVDEIEGVVGKYEQFEIVVQPYTVGEDTENFSIIRVVKGEVLWRPKLLPTVPPSPAPVCNKQFKITEWFDLPAFPVIDDDNSLFIGDGGIRVLKIGGLDIEIYVFKQSNASTDTDPIIVATSGYTPACPVIAPAGLPELPTDAVWEVVKIGSLHYTSPDPEANPPIPGGWTVTQNYIGSISLPSSNNDGGSGPSPSDFYKNQFQAVVTSVTVNPPEGGDPVTQTRLQFVKGTVLWNDNKCQDQTYISTIDARSPVTITNGTDLNSPYMNQGGWVVLGTGTYEAYLFNVKREAEGGSVYEQFMYVCQEGHYTESCPVVLPEEIRPDYLGIDYEAECIRVAYNITLSSVAQDCVGTLAFKPFKVKPVRKDFEIYVEQKVNIVGEVEVIENVMYINNGTVIYLEGECVEGTLLSGIPEHGPGISVRDDGGILVGEENLVEVDLYRIKYIPTSGPVTYRNVLWAWGEPIPVGCPVELPPQLLPETGTYEAQRLHIGFAGGPYVIDGKPYGTNFLFGPVSWPTKPGNDHPFKVSSVNETTYTVKAGAVNNAIPTNMTSTVEVTGSGYVWLVVPYSGSSFNPSSLVIAAGPSVPTDTDSQGYISLAFVNAGTVSQFVTGSLWASRIKVGELTAQYYYSRI